MIRCCKNDKNRMYPLRNETSLSLSKGWRVSNYIQFETRYCLYSNICLFKNMLKLAYFFALISMLWNNPSIIAPVEKVNLDQTPPRNHIHTLFIQSWRWMFTRVQGMCNIYLFSALINYYLDCCGLVLIAIRFYTNCALFVEQNLISKTYLRKRIKTRKT